MEKKQHDILEKALSELTGALHKEFVFTRLATQEQWNESVAPKLRNLHLAIDGYSESTPTPRNYKYPDESVWD